ncbi:YCII-like protein, putative (macronuclear) [Tetrahymena thermophila SB210]|uniref:YCII-like protein, putative n=1 Tax=Tetrahymena thermophila (strain SB210) TaxID=312017 RepID=I7LW10_TETTS|nr:YCII-like protein, putative [Tetrahymena thermophila SB210]EAS00544.1 YCII-like protein, putative [Tetrahymena thermophila SB210]|eukprot:XP_001020789.1 YCII-like protein, putative [Tetrahymena thermophila SB210]
MISSLKQAVQKASKLNFATFKNFSYIPDQYSRFFMVKYNLVEDFGYKRVAQDSNHLEKVRDLEEKGNILFGGNSVNNDSAFFLFYANDERLPYDFIKSDPYYLNGLVQSYTITEVEIPKRSDQKEITTQAKYN